MTAVLREVLSCMDWFNILLLAFRGESGPGVVSVQGLPSLLNGLKQHQMVRCGFAKQGKSLQYAWKKILWCELLEGVKESELECFVLGLVFVLLWEKAKSVFKSEQGRWDIKPERFRCKILLSIHSKTFILHWKTLSWHQQHINRGTDCDCGVCHGVL